MTRAILFRFVLLSLCASPFVAEANVLNPFWGGRIVPVFDTSLAVSVDLLQFTEYDGDTARYGSLRGTDSSWYHSTIGFNLLSASRPFEGTRKGSFRTVVVPNASIGVANDAVTEFLQNEYTHKRAGVPPVPRGRVSEGLLAAIGTELDIVSVDYPVFLGVGADLSNIVNDVHLQVGVSGMELADKFGVKILLHSVFRCGMLQNSNKYLLSSDSRYFPKVRNQYLTHQTALGFSTTVFGIPLAGEAGFLATSGMFEAYDGGALEELFEYSRVKIWHLALEKFNDGFGGKDFGPTYGVRFVYER